MATELSLILRFEDDYAPTAEDIESVYGCTVLEYVEEEV